jgi:hypothetical protein
VPRSGADSVEKRWSVAKPCGQFTPERAVTAGYWDPRYARVLWLSERDGLAIALIDTNGDGRVVEASLYGCQDGSWEEWVSNFGSGFTPDVVFTCGYAPEKDSVVIKYLGLEHSVPVTSTGMWYFASWRPANDSNEPEMPEQQPNSPYLVRTHTGELVDANVVAERLWAALNERQRRSRQDRR